MQTNCERDETRCSAICFRTTSQIPPNILEQLEKFDYSQDVPKIVIFNNEKSGELTRSDAVLFLF